MTIPTAIPVLGEVYKVEAVHCLSETSNHDGETDFESQVIKIDARLMLNPAKLMKVFTHELAHAWMEESGLNDILDEQAREMVAQTFSAQIRSVFELRFHEHLLEP